jgi:hypothetical protein
VSVRVNLAWVAEETADLLLGTAVRCSREEKNDSWVRGNLARAAGPSAVLYSYETTETTAFPSLPAGEGRENR